MLHGMDKSGTNLVGVTVHVAEDECHLRKDLRNGLRHLRRRSLHVSTASLY